MPKQTNCKESKIFSFFNLFCSNVKCNYVMGSSDPKKGLSLTFDVINLENGFYDSITLELGKLYCSACSWNCIVNYCMIFVVQLKPDFNQPNLTWLLIYKYCIEYNLLVSIYCYMIRFCSNHFLRINGVYWETSGLMRYFSIK